MPTSRLSVVERAGRLDGRGVGAPIDYAVEACVTMCVRVAPGAMCDVDRASEAIPNAGAP